MSGTAPDKGAGVVPIVYMTFPPFVGGVHSIVTLACSIPYTMLLTITSLGGPGECIGMQWHRKIVCHEGHQLEIKLIIATQKDQNYPCQKLWLSYTTIV